MEVTHLTLYKGEATKSEIKEYQSKAGSVTYAITKTRPNIAFTVSSISRYSHNPGPSHQKAVLRAIRHLGSTTNLGILYKANASNLLEFHSYSDSDFAGDPETRKSTSGYVFFMANGPVSWKSGRQSAVTLSSTEAEYYALTNAAKEAAFLRRFLTGLKYTGQDIKPTILHGDNQGSLALSENPEHH